MLFQMVSNNTDYNVGLKPGVFLKEPLLDTLTSNTGKITVILIFVT